MTFKDYVKWTVIIVLSPFIWIAGYIKGYVSESIRQYKILLEFLKVLDTQLKTGEITNDKYDEIAKQLRTRKLTHVDCEEYVIKYKMKFDKK